MAYGKKSNKSSKSNGGSKNGKRSGKPTSANPGYEGGVVVGKKK